MVDNKPDFRERPDFETFGLELKKLIDQFNKDKYLHNIQEKYVIAFMRLEKRGYISAIFDSKPENEINPEIIFEPSTGRIKWSESVGSIADILEMGFPITDNEFSFSSMHFEPIITLTPNGQVISYIDSEGTLHFPGLDF